MKTIHLCGSIFTFFVLFTAIPLFPDNSYLSRAYQLWMDGDYSKAESLYIRAVRDNEGEYKL
jgi:hypothetical protein